MKFLISTYCDPESRHEGNKFSEIAELTEPSKIDYCKIHGYDFISRKENLRTDRIIGWERIQLICDFMDKGYDWHLYTDCDLMLMNLTLPLTNFIDNNYDVIISKSSVRKDIIEINTGAILVKNSEWSKEFFNKINNKKEFFHHNWAEQQCMMEEINKDIEVQKHFKFIGNDVMNSYWHKFYIETNDNYKFPGFALHCAGTSNSYRYKLFSEIKDKIIRDNKTNYSEFKIETEPFL